METTILSWNVTNWITVVLMAALGFLVLALVAQVFHKFAGTKQKTGDAPYSVEPPGIAQA